MSILYDCSYFPSRNVIIYLTHRHIREVIRCLSKKCLAKPVPRLDPDHRRSSILQ